MLLGVFGRVVAFAHNDIDRFMAESVRLGPSSRAFRLHVAVPRRILFILRFKFSRRETGVFTYLEGQVGVFVVAHPAGEAALVAAFTFEDLIRLSQQ